MGCGAWNIGHEILDLSNWNGCLGCKIRLCRNISGKMLNLIWFCFCVQKSLGELKSFPNPPEICVDVVGATMCLMETKRGTKPPKDKSWKACKSFMGQVRGTALWKWGSFLATFESEAALCKANFWLYCQLTSCSGSFGVCPFLSNRPGGPVGTGKKVSLLTC